MGHHPQNLEDVARGLVRTMQFVVTPKEFAEYVRVIKQREIRDGAIVSGLLMASFVASIFIFQTPAPVLMTASVGLLVFIFFSQFTASGMRSTFKNPSYWTVLSRMQVSIDESGVVLNYADGTVITVPRHEVRHFFATKNTFVIMRSEFPLTIVPFAAFPDEESKQRFANAMLNLPRIKEEVRDMKDGGRR